MSSFIEYIFSDFWTWLGFTITLVLALSAFRPIQVIVTDEYETRGPWE